tara:strand:+ start:79 stop:243 length:165 start_codon:yes stop_codon:yes gene_type:complete
LETLTSAGATQIDENPFDDIDQLVSDALDAPSSSEEEDDDADDPFAALHAMLDA